MISQKATILCVLEILQKYTDEDHRISTEQIREKLKKIYNVDMERRTIYRNVDALRSVGFDIQDYSHNHEGYCLLDRDFEMSEVRLLCDAVAASDMIAPEVTKKLIKRLANKLSVFEGRMLQKTVYVKECKESNDHRIFYNIDTLNIAISQGCKVLMKKLCCNYQQGLSVTNDSPVLFNPYATIWAGGYYYVIGKDEKGEELIHYRIDRLKDIEITEYNVEILYGGLDPNLYAERHIYQKGESMIRFDVECDIDSWEDIMEVFGKNATAFSYVKGKLQVKIYAIPSVMKTWILGHCDKCELIGPKKYRDEIQNTIMEGYRKYWT